MASFVVGKKILAPYRLKVLRRILGNRPVKILDVGCGNDSCQLTKYWLNVTVYHGIPLCQSRLWDLLGSQQLLLQLNQYRADEAVR